jgi:hypothetical protein
MTKKPENQNSGDVGDPGFEDQVYRGLLAAGHVVPGTLSEVRTADSNIHLDVPPLPEDLRDPQAILRIIRKREEEDGTSNAIPFPLPPSPGMEDEVRRVARLGRSLSANTKAKMAANRNEADKKAAQEESAPE